MAADIVPASPSPPTKLDAPQLLVVDDQPAIRRLFSHALLGDGFGVRLAADGREALEVYREHGWDIDLVLLDVTMPGELDGLRTLAALREIDPDVRCCFMSGEFARYPVDVLLERGVLAVLLKPFDLAELMRTFRELARARLP
jgi:CheY-like chemotaxis protein